MSTIENYADLFSRMSLEQLVEYTDEFIDRRYRQSQDYLANLVDRLDSELTVNVCYERLHGGYRNPIKLHQRYLRTLVYLSNDVLLARYKEASESHGWVGAKGAYLCALREVLEQRGLMDKSKTVFIPVE